MYVMIILLIILLIIGGAAIFAIHAYNNIQKLNVNVDEAESQINVQLQRRADLIPNLVNTVKGYAKHEESTLKEITSLRNGLTNGDLQSRITASQKLTTQVMAVAENYPDLKANSNFNSLQEELTNTENKIGYARQLYNSTVGTFNRAIAMFPGNLIAGMMNVQKRDYLKVEAATKVAPKVEF